MGLTNQSTGAAVHNSGLQIHKQSESDRVIALAGNPNVGKSTVFNALTGMNQHTGNWPGKTVTNAQGSYQHDGQNYILVDLPGTYSLMASSVEEEVARDFICFSHPDAVVIVADATCLERNLNLVLQTLEANQNSVLCVNLLDEARKKKIEIDLDELSLQLGVPVVGTNARSGIGLDNLKNEIGAISKQEKKTYQIRIAYDSSVEKAVELLLPYIIPLAAASRLNPRWLALRLLEQNESLLASLSRNLETDPFQLPGLKPALKQAFQILQEAGLCGEDLRDHIAGAIVMKAEEIFLQSVKMKQKTYDARDRKIDRILTSKATGIPIMIALLCVIFWLTMTGANYPSALLSNLFFWIEGKLTDFFIFLHAPEWLNGLLISGMFRTLSWVVSVMLPPMAIFFPLFTLLEDAGYLPRVAFNMDKYFKKACAHGKQSLTMCMGFGCNACGVIGCRIIDSPRERLIAILTNNFVPCNGRFPTLIALITMFFAGAAVFPLSSVLSTIFLTGIILLGISTTLLVSRFLSKTILKGLPSTFVLELPPFRRPQIGKVIVRSIFDRTLFVLGRAVSVAAPAGILIWLMSNLLIGDVSILTHCANFLNPFAKFIGLDGMILLAFILGLPANEIVIPIMIMGYLSTGSLIELDSLTQLHTLFVANGWTWVTALCTMLFSLMHFPCATTLWTIKKETKSWKWTALSFLIPTVSGIVICMVVANTAKLIGFLSGV